MTRRTKTVKRLAQTLTLAATASAFWLAAGAPLYRTW